MTESGEETPIWDSMVEEYGDILEGVVIEDDEHGDDAEAGD